MEWWNIGKSKIPSLAGLILKGSFSFIYILNFPVNMNFTNKPLYHFPITQYSTIPLFQHSNRGVAPKLLAICFHVKRNFANNPIYHLPKTHYSIIPFFHYSPAMAG